MNRRQLLHGILTASVAPAIVRAGRLPEESEKCSISMPRGNRLCPPEKMVMDVKRMIEKDLRANFDSENVVVVFK